MNARFEEIRKLVVATDAGKEAAFLGDKLDANPYAEEDERHWRWLDGWCLVMERIRKSNDAGQAAAQGGHPSEIDG